jgi:hypothetical protein
VPEVTRGRPEPPVFPFSTPELSRYFDAVCEHAETQTIIARAAAVICVLCLAGCVACLVVAALIVLP